MLKQNSKINSVLQKYPNTLVQVVGHTDSRGTHAYNQTLSKKELQMLKYYLIQVFQNQIFQEVVLW